MHSYSRCPLAQCPPMEDSRDESRTSLVKRENGPGHNTESPEVLLAVWYNSGTLWVMINRARNLMICSGKVYGKTYLLPDSGNSKQKTQLVESSSNPQFNATIAVSGININLCKDLLYCDKHLCYTQEEKRMIQRGIVS